jgi:hypothetical protein
MGIITSKIQNEDIHQIMTDEDYLVTDLKVDLDKPVNPCLQ